MCQRWWSLKLTLMGSLMTKLSQLIKNKRLRKNHYLRKFMERSLVCCDSRVEENEGVEGGGAAGGAEI